MTSGVPSCDGENKRRSWNKVSFMGWKYSKSKSAVFTEDVAEKPSSEPARNANAIPPEPPVRSSSLPNPACKPTAKFQAAAQTTKDTKTAQPENTKYRDESEPEESDARNSRASSESSEYSDCGALPSMDFNYIAKQQPAPAVAKSAPRKKFGLPKFTSSSRKKTAGTTTDSDSTDGQIEDSVGDNVNEIKAERKFKRRSTRTLRFFRSKSSVMSSHDDSVERSQNEMEQAKALNAKQAVSRGRKGLDCEDQSNCSQSSTTSRDTASESCSSTSTASASSCDNVSEEEFARVAAF